MRKDVSLWLDAMRALAAFAVFVAHIRLFGVADPELARFVPQLGHDAVVLFFVLSGYVIAFTTDARNASLSQYLTARAARIYSVTVPAIAVTYILAWIGESRAPGVHEYAYQLERLWLYVPFQLGFLGEMWAFSEPPCTNVPWWSLGYEVWYYVLFAVFAFYRGPRRWILLGIGLLLVGPKLWLLAPTWALGAVLWRNRERFALSRTLARILLFGSFAAYVIYKVSGVEQSLIALGNAPFGGVADTPLGSAQSWLHDYVVAVLAAIHLHALGHAHLSLPTFSERPIRVAASFTFSLYLMHAPMLLFVRYVVDYDRRNGMQVLALSLAVLAAIGVIGLFTEHRKGPYRRGFGWLFARIAGWFRAAPGLRRVLVPNA